MSVAGAGRDCTGAGDGTGLDGEVTVQAGGGLVAVRLDVAVHVGRSPHERGRVSAIVEWPSWFLTHRISAPSLRSTWRKSAASSDSAGTAGRPWRAVQSRCRPRNCSAGGTRVIGRFTKHRSPEGSPMEPDFGRNLTGRVDFFVNGLADAPATSELIANARKARYLDDQAAEFRYADGDVTAKLTPPDFQDLALAQAATTGLLLFKLDISGKGRSRRVTLEPGTYYFVLNLVHERWVGRALDARGQVACTTLGILVRQQVNYHPGRKHTERPEISLHRVFESTDTASKPGRTIVLQQADNGWADVQIEWKEFGAGCQKVIICVPGPDQ
jgi:hypothetical protein